MSASDIDLAVEDPETFLAALRRVRNLQLRGITISTAPPRGFPPLSHTVDADDDIEAYLNVVARYPFDPAIPPDERIRLAVDAVLDIGGSYAARALSLMIGSDESSYPLSQVLDYVKARGLHSDHEVDQAAWLVDYLLDDQDMADDVVTALERWRGRSDLERVLDVEADRLWPD